MQLRLITDQGGSFDDYYATCTSSNTSPMMLEAIEHTRKLFRHLEQNVDGPPQWVTISHLTWFYLSDEDTWKPGEACVFVYPRRYGYEIKYRSSPDLHFWDAFTTLEAHNEVEAGNLILEALRMCCLTRSDGLYAEEMPP